jgi:hypothetical protein
LSAKPVSATIDGTKAKAWRESGNGCLGLDALVEEAWDRPEAPEEEESFLTPSRVSFGSREEESWCGFVESEEGIEEGESSSARFVRVEEGMRGRLNSVISLISLIAWWWPLEEDKEPPALRRRSLFGAVPLLGSTLRGDCAGNRVPIGCGR